MSNLPPSGSRIVAVGDHEGLEGKDFTNSSLHVLDANGGRSFARFVLPHAGIRVKWFPQDVGNSQDAIATSVTLERPPDDEGDPGGEAQSIPVCGRVWCATGSIALSFSIPEIPKEFDGPCRLASGRGVGFDCKGQGAGGVRGGEEVWSFANGFGQRFNTTLFTGTRGGVIQAHEQGVSSATGGMKFAHKSIVETLLTAEFSPQQLFSRSRDDTIAAWDLTKGVRRCSVKSTRHAGSWWRAELGCVESRQTILSGLNTFVCQYDARGPLARVGKCKVTQVQSLCVLSENLVVTAGLPYLNFVDLRKMKAARKRVRMPGCNYWGLCCAGPRHFALGVQGTDSPMLTLLRHDAKVVWKCGPSQNAVSVCYVPPPDDIRLLFLPDDENERLGGVFDLASRCVVRIALLGDVKMGAASFLLSFSSFAS